MEQIHLTYRPSKTIIRQLRDAVDFSQTQLAKQLGFEQSYISRLEHRERRLPISQANILIRFAGSLGIRIDLDDLAKDYILFDKNKHVVD